MPHTWCCYVGFDRQNYCVTNWMMVSLIYCVGLHFLFVQQGHSPAWNPKSRWILRTFSPLLWLSPGEFDVPATAHTHKTIFVPVRLFWGEGNWICSKWKQHARNQTKFANCTAHFICLTMEHGNNGAMRRWKHVAHAATARREASNVLLGHTRLETRW